MFITQFMAGIMRRKPTGTLMSIQQGRDESLKEFLLRFNQERRTTESPTEEFVHSALYQGIRKDGPLMADLARKPTRYLHEFMERADEFINQEETLQALLGKGIAQTSNQGEKSKKKKEFHKRQDAAESCIKKKFQDYNWTPLNAPIEEVLAAIKTDPMYEKPAEMVGTPHPRSADRYCAFHESKGHSTETCRSLRALIEKFIRNGKLVRFLAGQRGPPGFDRNPQPEQRKNQPQRYREEPREKGWNVPGIAIGSLTTDQPTGTCEREAGVKRGCLVGKTSSKFIQYPVVLGAEVIQMRRVRHMRGT
jgi:hypothetical protein